MELKIYISGFVYILRPYRKLVDFVRMLYYTTEKELLGYMRQYILYYIGFL